MRRNLLVSNSRVVSCSAMNFPNGLTFLARKFGLPVVPHAGDMGQIHQSLVLFDHIALDAPILFLQNIPHLRSHLVHPAQVEEGV